MNLTCGLSDGTDHDRWHCHDEATESCHVGEELCLVTRLAGENTLEIHLEEKNDASKNQFTNPL